ncbi:MAG: hypothetical protein AAF690_23640 [Acidobacteriota bacterium]
MTPKTIRAPFGSFDADETPLGLKSIVAFKKHFADEGPTLVPSRSRAEQNLRFWKHYRGRDRARVLTSIDRWHLYINRILDDVVYREDGRAELERLQAAGLTAVIV